ncbi:GNAT family N-acetyltransferase [Liquorilactobacillus hordei]|uniref:GNAT family N-acetyltransferase n=1 Tax=Liquorilactobacillus hordei TaxID=468911 RepID=UPI001CBDC57A|nr:GNAT family N-acetyltransferase [Liquorilactobacillus hordei]MBZ2406488.1 GNAT family N-acetyltransferase [Liquorilactobacillus hordei]
MIYQVSGTNKISKLFNGWNETIIWSCLQGVMGHLYADSIENPQSAMAILGDFCFLAGVPNQELVSFKPEWCMQDFIIMSASSNEWFKVIEAVYGKRCTKVSRYAIKKEPNIFDERKLQVFAEDIPDKIELTMIDKQIFNYCLQNDWSRDFVSLYKNYEEYEKLGIGVVALSDNLPVAGASSYSCYKDGIEIEIDTKIEFRRRGLATACAAKLILECKKKNLYPSWDAHNPWSVGLAQKLGYHFDKEYQVYEIRGY